MTGIGSVNPMLTRGTAIKGQRRAIEAASAKTVIKLFAYQSVSNALLTCCGDHYFSKSVQRKWKKKQCFFAGQCNCSGRRNCGVFVCVYTCVCTKLRKYDTKEEGERAEGSSPFVAGIYFIVS